MSAELSYMQIKADSEARLSEEVLAEQRRKNLLVLIRSYLEEQGFLDSVQTLSREAGSTLRQFCVCDNIDLLTILQEYESYYYIKFKKQPKLTKRLGGSAATKSSSHSKGPGSVSLPNIGSKQTSSSVGKKRRKKPDDGGEGGVVSPVGATDEESLGVSGTTVKPLTSVERNGRKAARTDHGKGDECTPEDPQVRLLKPLSGFTGYDSEMRDLAAVISRDIYSQDPNVRWEDIIGLDNAKRLVKEAVVYPIKYPGLFTGILSPWKGLLLYGPPGTGKTLLAKAVATECGTTFFNISASTIVSKWRGDSEKLVRVLFELARFHAPSTIFMDELDSIMSQRAGSSSAGGEHEGSRRMKTELLVQMDGLARSSDLVFVLAASNLPWELDHAMLRRLEKRILVDLPIESARRAMICHHLPAIISHHPVEIRTNVDYDTVARLTEGYSGSDIHLVCKEAAMSPLRKVFDTLEAMSSVGSNWEKLSVAPVTTADVQTAISRTKPSAGELGNRYQEWQSRYKSV